MFKKITGISMFLASATTLVMAQVAQEEPTSEPLQISGSVDTYYKYDFENVPNNILTYFADEHNSISIGMIDIALKKNSGKASFVGELSFGPRGTFQSIPNAAPVTSENGVEGFSSFNIQNLYVNYAFTDKFSMTAGYMGTFVGYEVISPVANFNYSTSYLFGAGPFQNAGIKATYSFSPKASLMVGLFNDWNIYQDFNGVSHVGAQLMLAPAEGWSAYLNVLSGYSNQADGTGTILDLTTSYQITEKFKLGLNAADYSVSNDNGGYSGVALYPQYSITPGFSLGARGEYFKVKDAGSTIGNDFTSLTLSGNLKSGSFTFIPEVRFDNGDAGSFTKNNLIPTENASQFSLAAVFAF
ncbi:porin [Daejeonella oryzae]|uniref:porin n=1 Tax=Daejeonella oryzae TaxID=1122943 RepID=UPI000428FBD7|nr:porin [Daejeonella oryzae]